MKRNLAGALVMALILTVGLSVGGAGAELPISLQTADVVADATGAGAAFVYMGSEFGPSGDPEWKAQGDRKEAQFGFSVSTAGDVNGDEYDDVIVGAPGYAEGSELNSRGAAYIYYGSADGLSVTADWSYVSEQTHASLGWAVSTAGDVNGDGYADIVIGAPWCNGVVTDTGAVLLFYGSASGLSTTPYQILEGDQQGARFGAAVAGGGDIDGDGHDDVVIGAPDYDSDEENPDLNDGAAYIYYGSDDGLVETPAILTAGSMPAGAQFGISVGISGDVNGDVYSDVIVGAPGWEATPREERLEGAVFLFLGRNDRPALIGSSWRGEGDKADAGLGWSVSPAVDVNHDYLDGIIAGAPYCKHSDSQKGAAYVYWWDDGVDDLTSNPVLFFGDEAGDEFGYAVGTARVVDEYGHVDYEVVVGARKGEASKEVPDVVVGNEGAVSSLYSASGATWEVGSGQTGALFGQSVATAGDVNGDGKADIIVGAPGYKASSFAVMLPLVLNGTR